MNNNKKRRKKIRKTRIFMLIFSIMLFISIFSCIRVLAEPDALKLEEAIITDKSNTVTGDITNISDDKIEDNITFHRINDDITYRIVIKNNLDKEITILSIEDDNNNEYITFEYDKHQNEILGSGGSIEFFVTTRYNNSVMDMSKRNQNTSTNFIINYKIAGKSNGNSILVNPNTSSNFPWFIFTFIVSNVGIIICMIVERNNSKNNSSKMAGLLIIGLMLSPIIVKAETLSYKIKLTSYYGLYDKQVVTYIVNGEEKSLINQYGETINGLETPVKEGYTFDKWTYEDGSDFDPTKELTSDINLIAKMNKIIYSITYDLNGGILSSSNPTEYTITDNITLQEPTKDYYLFKGWTGTDLQEPTKNVVINNIIGDRNYIANYSPINYTISYSGLTNEEKNALNNPTSYNIESNEVTLSNPQNRKDNDGDIVETFVGWKEGTTTSTTITIPNMNSIGNKTYEAIWAEASPKRYTITYELNGGTTATDNPVEFTKKTETFELENPTKTGYDFRGWSGTDLIGDENKKVIISQGTKKNLFFEAHYNPISYQIKFEKNSNNVTGEMANQVFEYDEENNLNDVLYKKEGYTFEGWNTEADKTGTHYNNQDLIKNLTSTKDTIISLYAEWSPNSYTIKLDANAPEGSIVEGTMNDVSMIFDEPKSLPLNMYSVEGYTFDGWNTKADGSGIKFDNGDSVNNIATSGNIILYGTWKPNSYIIQFNKNGGEGSMSDLEMTYGESKSLTKSLFTKEGYTFDGWNTKIDQTGTHFSDEDLVKNITSENHGIVVLYSEWKANTYIIRPNSNAPTDSTSQGSMEDILMTYDIPKDLTENKFSAAGYIFDSWNTKADGSGTKINDKAIINNLGTTGIVELYAQWIPGNNTPYTIIHKKMNVDGVTYTEADRDELTGKTHSEVTPNVKEYYGFTAPTTQKISIAADGSTVLEYLYTRNKYTLTINDAEYVEDDKSGEYYYEEQISLTAKERENYKFTGWSNGEANKTIIITIPGNITIKPTYEYNAYVITLNPNGGGVTPSEITVTKGESIGALPIPVKQFNDFAGWYTSLDFTTKVTEDLVPQGNVTYFAKWEPFETSSLLCRKATSLHTAVCPTNAACNKAGYSETGSRGTNIVTFGIIPHAELEAGNAYDCDVNSDGIYDDETERFYYLTTKGNNAVLISHTNYEGEEGQIIINNYIYSEAITKLPQKIKNEWKNVRITFSNPVDTSDTSIYAARFPTYDEIKQATGKNSLTAVGSLDDYPYLMENTMFVGVGRSGIWLESDTANDSYYRIHTGTNARRVTDDSTTKNAARPVIEVPLELMDLTDDETNTYTISFESNDGPSVEPIIMEKNTPLGPLPSIARNGYEFDGWYYETNFTTKAKETDLVTKEITLYAKWNIISEALINDTYYTTLSDAINAVQANEEETVVKLLKDTSSALVIDKKKNIILDLQGHTLTNSSTDCVISNKGYIEVKNGVINTDSENTSAIDNNDGAVIKIKDLTINATGEKQALYNNNGNAEISGDCHFSSTSTNRATVHNLSNGIMTIKSGEIISTGYHGVFNESGILTIGEAEGVIDTSKPVLQGIKSGLSIADNQKFNFYDGIIKGIESAIDVPSSLEGKEEESEIKNDIEEIDGQTYKTAIMYMNTSKYKITFEANGGTVSPNYKIIEKGDAIGNLPIPSKGVYTFDGWYTESSGGEEISSDYIPNKSMTIYARYHYSGTDEIIEFNMTSDAMNNYYSNINTWISDTTTFQSNMDTNFNNYNCSECTGPNYQACPTPAGNKTLCEQSKGYSIGTNNINVYEFNETSNKKESLATYTTIKNEAIYNMIPGKIYYWEDKDDSNVHGYVKAIGKRRTIESNVRNVRDLGGLEADIDNDGIIDGTIKYGRIFRGAKLSSNTSDVSELQKLGITEEVDLRGSSGDAKFSDYKGRAITNYLIYPDTYNANYKVFRQALIDTMQDIINGKNIYLHCAIGTDRTGTISYFIEGLLGVSEEDRVEDYEISYFTGLLNRHRFHDNLKSSSINPRFTTMHNTYRTNQSIYDYFMIESTDTTADDKLIQDFREAMIDFN